MTTPGTVLRWLRKRPLPERRAAGITLYLILAAVTVSLWVTSLPSLLSPPPAAPPTGETGKGSAEQPAPPHQPLAELITPFQTLASALTGTAARFRELAAEATRIIGEGKNAPASGGAAAPEAEPATGTPPLLSPAPEVSSQAGLQGAAAQRAASTAPKATREKVAAVMAGELLQGKLPTGEVASLIAPLPSPPGAEEGVSSTIAERIAAAWRSNVNGVRSALEDLIRYVKE